MDKNPLDKPMIPVVRRDHFTGDRDADAPKTVEDPIDLSDEAIFAFFEKYESDDNFSTLSKVEREIAYWWFEKGRRQPLQSLLDAQKPEVSEDTRAFTSEIRKIKIEWVGPFTAYHELSIEEAAQLTATRDQALVAKAVEPYREVVARIEERARRMSGKATGEQPLKSATEACAWIAKEARALLSQPQEVK